MNKYWPKKWNKQLPNFLGEDFFSSFDFLEEDEQQSTADTHSPSQLSGIKVNIYESANELLCIFRVPGLNLNDVHIDVYDKTLEITGRVQIDHLQFRPIHLELYEGPITRKVKLPYPVRHDKMDASYSSGYLYLRLHRLIRPKETEQKLKIKNLDGTHKEK